MGWKDGGGKSIPREDLTGNWALYSCPGPHSAAACTKETLLLSLSNEKECDPGKESPSPPTGGFRETRVSCHSIFYFIFYFIFISRPAPSFPRPSLTSLSSRPSAGAL